MTWDKVVPMSNSARTASIAAVSLVCAAVLSVGITHVVVWVLEEGFRTGLRTAFLGDHHRYWGLLIVATVMVLGIAIVRSDGQSLKQSAPTVRTVGVVLVALLVLTVGGLLLLENVETLVAGQHALAGFGPLRPLLTPGGVVALIGTSAVLAFLIAPVLKRTRPSYESVLTSSYVSLATDVYGATFRHEEWAERFFADVLRGLPMPDSDGPIRVLECGTGSGFWLTQVDRLERSARPFSLRGFDLSRDMIEQARQRQELQSIGADLSVGDLLDDAAYQHEDGDDYGLVFAYDVVQQLPRRLQPHAVEAMFKHVTPGGWLVIFDHDAASRYGRSMGAKKWLRRHLGVPLVPKHYVNASYPYLGRLRALLLRMGAIDVAARVEEQGRHRALVARKPAHVGLREGAPTRPG